MHSKSTKEFVNTSILERSGDYSNKHRCSKHIKENKDPTNFFYKDATLKSQTHSNAVTLQEEDCFERKLAKGHKKHLN